jgi:hypothetical protein
MYDGVGRIDEEIWHACRERGYISSFSTVRHGRLTLSEVGLLIDTGQVRLTSDKAPSSVWQWNPNPPDIVYRRGPKPPVEILEAAIIELRRVYVKHEITPTLAVLQTIGWLKTLTKVD